MSNNNRHEEWQEAERIDQLIDQTQRADNEQPLVADLSHLAQSIQPDPAFVQALAAQLEQRMRQDTLGKANPAQRNPMSAGRRFLFPLRQGLPGRLAITSVMLLLLLLTGLIATPSTRAALIEIIFGLQRVEQRDLAGLRVPVVEPQRAPHLPSLTLAELHSLVPFPLHLPSDLPEGLEFTGGAVVEEVGSTQVSVVYHPHTERQPDGAVPFGTPALLLFMATGQDPALPMLDSASLQATTVANQPAFYAHGGWQAETSADSATELENIHWDATLDADWLTWQEGTITYLLQADGLQIGQAGIIRIAESLQEVRP